MPKRKDLHPEVSIEKDFERFLGHASKWLRANLMVLALSVAAVAVVLAALTASLGARASRQEGIIRDLEGAESAGVVTPEDLRDAAERAEGTVLHARALLMCADAFFAAARFEDARQSYEQLLADHPDSFLAWPARLALGAALEELAQKDRARQVYQDIVRDLSGTFCAQRATERLVALDKKTPASQPVQNAEENKGGA